MAEAAPWWRDETTFYELSEVDLREVRVGDRSIDAVVHVYDNVDRHIANELRAAMLAVAAAGLPQRRTLRLLNAAEFILEVERHTDVRGDWPTLRRPDHSGLSSLYPVQLIAPFGADGQGNGLWLPAQARMAAEIHNHERSVQ